MSDTKKEKCQFFNKINKDNFHCRKMNIYATNGDLMCYDCEYKIIKETGALLWT
jgi:hypothetical protein